MESVVVETRRARGVRACGLTRTDGGGALKSELCSGQGRTPSRRRADRPAYCGEQRCAARERGSQRAVRFAETMQAIKHAQ